MRVIITEKQYSQIQKYLLEAINSDELERVVSSLPNVEVKGGASGELDNNGDIDYEFSKEFQSFIRDMSKCCPRCKFRITAGNDKYHSRDPKSLHPKGLAIDFTSEPYKQGRYCAGKVLTKYPNFHFIDEYQNPSSRSTGGHFHVGYKKQGTTTKSPTLNLKGDSQPTSLQNTVNNFISQKISKGLNIPID